MEARHLTSAEAARRAIERGLHDPSAFRAVLLGVPAGERDAWVDLVLGLDDLPGDGPALPAGGVPYLPCSVELLLRVVDGAPVRATAANAGPAGPRPDSRLIIAATPIRPPDGDKYWAFHVVNDSRERIESIVLESVSTVFSFFPFQSNSHASSAMWPPSLP